MPTLRAAALLLAIAALSAACSASGPRLADHQFLSVAVTENGAARPLVQGTRIRLGFGATELTASAGCNTIGGTYRLDDGRLVVDAVGMTEMGCDAARHAQDEWLSTVLSSRPRVTLVGSDLTVEGAGVVIRMVDREIAEPDLNLVGPTWTVESILTGDAVASIPGGATATFVFQADGSVSVSPGCNRGGGTWKLDGAGLEITGVVLTKMACQGPGGALEAAVLQVIGAGPLRATIDASVLTLQGAGGGLQLRGG